MAAAGVDVPRVSPSCPLPLLEPLQDQQTGPTCLGSKWVTVGEWNLGCNLDFQSSCQPACTSKRVGHLLHWTAWWRGSQLSAPKNWTCISHEEDVPYNPQTQNSYSSTKGCRTQNQNPAGGQNWDHLSRCFILQENWGLERRRLAQLHTPRVWQN